MARNRCEQVLAAATRHAHAPALRVHEERGALLLVDLNLAPEARGGVAAAVRAADDGKDAAAIAAHSKVDVGRRRLLELTHRLRERRALVRRKIRARASAHGTAPNAARPHCALRRRART